MRLNGDNNKSFEYPHTLFHALMYFLIFPKVRVVFIYTFRDEAVECIPSSRSHNNALVALTTGTLFSLYLH